MKAETCLFLFAHPDDEIFSAGTMRRLLNNNADVHGLWVTSGDARSNAKVRESELRAGLQILGVKDSRIHLLRLPNRGLLPILDHAIERVAGVLQEIMPDKIFVTAYEGGHIDHDAVNFIAYEGLNNSHFDIFLIGVDGRGPIQLTRDSGNNESPTWSPDGTLIAFSSTREGPSRIYVMNANGTEQRRLLVMGGEQTDPSWSPRLGSH